MKRKERAGRAYGRGRSRGFASAFAFAFAITTLAAAAALTVQLGADKAASVASLEALNVGWRFDDASKIASLTATDAVVDAAYASCGCGRSGPGTFLALAREKAASYYANASSILSDGVYRTEFSGAEVAGTVGDANCNINADVTVSVGAKASSPNAMRKESLGFERKLLIRKTEAQVNFDVSDGNGKKLAGIQVACS